MKSDRFRWAVMLAPLFLPWVVVSWEGGYYVVFALGWVDAGFRVVSILTFVEQGAVGLGLRNFTIAYPVALVAYLGALALARWRSDSDAARAVVAVLMFLSGLNVGFYALGINAQGTITAIPVGLLWLWAGGVYEYHGYFSSP